MELQDSEGRIQVYISRDDICPDENKDTYNVVFKKLLDIGDSMKEALPMIRRLMIRPAILTGRGSASSLNVSFISFTYNVVFKKLLDIGDFVGIKGFVFRTQMGEISVHAQELTVKST